MWPRVAFVAQSPGWLLYTDIIFTLPTLQDAGAAPEMPAAMSSGFNSRFIWFFLLPAYWHCWITSLVQILVGYVKKRDSCGCPDSEPISQRIQEQERFSALNQQREVPFLKVFLAGLWGDLTHPKFSTHAFQATVLPLHLVKDVAHIYKKLTDFRKSPAFAYERSLKSHIPPHSIPWRLTLSSTGKLRFSSKVVTTFDKVPELPGKQISS